jgi:aminoglycoside phosphotransferase (APT) family kinase protein
MQEPGVDPSEITTVAGNAEHCLEQELSDHGEGLGSLQVPEFTPVYEWLQSRQSAVVTRGPALIHMDSHPHNVLVDRADRLHLLDWSLARVTDPRSDLAQTFQMLASAGFERMRAPILDAYQAAAGAPMPGMEFFDVFAALKNAAGQFAVLDDGERKRPELWQRLAQRPNWPTHAARLRANRRPHAVAIRRS